MRYLQQFVRVLVVAATVACGGRVPAPASQPPRVLDTLGPVLSPGRLYYNDGPAFRDSVRRIVRDPAAWQAVWQQAMSAHSSPIALPAVDFSTQMVIVVASGLMTPGDQIRVDSAGTRGATFTVITRTTAECQPFSATIYPHEIVIVPRSDLPAEWVERVQRAPRCG